MSFVTKTEQRQMPRLDGRGEAVHMGKVEADDRRCTGCGLCVDACPGGALRMAAKKQVRMIDADPVPCMACGICVAICEPAAIRLTEPHRYGGFFKFLHRDGLSWPRRF